MRDPRRDPAVEEALDRYTHAVNEYYLRVLRDVDERAEAADVPPLSYECDIIHALLAGTPITELIEFGVARDNSFDGGEVFRRVEVDHRRYWYVVGDHITTAHPRYSQVSSLAQRSPEFEWLRDQAAAGKRDVAAATVVAMQGGRDGRDSGVASTVNDVVDVLLRRLRGE